MVAVFKNDFKRWHFSFLFFYLLTYMAGILRSRSAFFYQIHPLVGILSVVVPLLVYLTAKNKVMIRKVIKSNFNLKGKPLIKVAKVSTMVIMVYYVFSIFSGFLLNNSLYNSKLMYQVLTTIHEVAVFLVPLAVISHVAARLILKRKKVNR